MSAPRMKLTASQLMGECRENKQPGGWEPEAIEHWRWMVRNGEGKERALAWVKLKSIANGSPYCIDADTGKELRVESMAADLGWALKTARNACTELVNEGRIRLQKGKRIWYRADVPEGTPLNAPESRVPGIHAGYLVDFLNTQPEAKQAEIRAAHERFEKWSKAVTAEAMTQVRAQIARVELTMFRHFGAPKISLRKEKPPAPKWIQLDLLQAPDFVQGTSTDQQHTAKSGSVQGAPSLLLSDSDADSTTQHHQRPAAVADDAALDLLTLAEVPKNRANAEHLAALIARGHALPVIRAAILLGRTRRMTGKKPGDFVAPVRSLQYFDACLEEARTLKPGYVEHLEQTLKRWTAQLTRARTAGGNA